MRLGTAFPFILDRQYAVVKPEFPLITVLHLLRMQDLAGVPLTSNNGRCKAIFGFSSLESLLNIGQERFADFVQGPCGKASDELDCFDMDQELTELLDCFKSRGLGCAAVRGPDPGGRWTIVTLADVVRLYENELIKTDLVAEDVASPIFSMPGSASIREALRAMFKHQYRRVFVSRDGCYVSDRSIIDYVLSPDSLDSIALEPQKDPLATPISEIWSFAPAPIGLGMDIRVAALKLRERRAECLITRGGRVITPWDLVMKPWLSGKLVVADEPKGLAAGRSRPRSRGR